jgi:hypothetical protein
MNQIKPQHQENKVTKEKTVRIQKLEIAFIDYFSCKTKEKIITNQEIYARRINKEMMKRKQFTRDNQIKTHEKHYFGKPRCRKVDLQFNYEQSRKIKNSKEQLIEEI